MSDSTIVQSRSLPEHYITCQDCSVSRLCFPMVFDDDQLVHFEGVSKQVSTLKKGVNLFQAGEPFSKVYVIRSGSVKTVKTTAEGEQQVTGFYYPGEIVGLDSVNQVCYASFATALETSSICGLSFRELERVAAQIPSLQQQLFRIMSQELIQEQELILLLNKKHAEARLAAFLVNLSARFSRRKLSPLVLRLSMSQGDIADYLGMANETVSRILAKWRQAGVISTAQYEMTLLDFNRLCVLAQVECRLHQR